MKPFQEDAMSQIFLGVTMLIAMLSVVAPTRAQDHATYGVELEGFDYPHDVNRYRFRSQGGDVSMAYMDVTPQTANGRSVVLLHGRNFCAATWEKTIAVLSKAGFRVIAPDQIGFCKSTKPLGYQFSIQQLATNTNALLTSLGVSRPIIVGHSFGGMMAMRYALMFPGAVEQIVLVNPIGLEDWQAAGVPFIDLDKGLEIEKATTFDSIKQYEQKIYYADQWKPEYDRWVEMIAGMYRGPGAERIAHVQARVAEMAFIQPVVHEFERIRVPTVLIIGQLDRTALGANRAPADLAKQLGNYPELGRAAARRIPHAKLIEFPELGHAPQIQAPDQFHEALLKSLGAR
jgi:pimeloyl-ACP methyl ester carboxylesterase